MNGFDEWSIVFALCIVLFVLALRSVWRSAAHSRKAKLAWTAITAVPVVGPALWFLVGIQRHRHR